MPWIASRAGLKSTPPPATPGAAVRALGRRRRRRSVLRLGEQAAGLVQVDRVGRGQAGVEPVGLLAVVLPLGVGEAAVGVDLARIVQRAGLALLVEGVVDAGDLQAAVVDDRRAGRAADGLAGGVRVQ